MSTCTKKPIFYFKQTFLVWLHSMLLVGCSITSDTMMKNVNISRYAEQLFKRQNLLTQQVMMLSEDDIPAVQEDEFYQVELQMHEACRLLNEYANREIDGEKITIFFQRQVQSSFQGCETAVLNLEVVIDRINSSVE